MTDPDYRVLVCGGRDYRDVERLNAALDALHSRRSITLVIEGGAYGADRLAAAWAKKHGIEVRTFEADWEHLGKAAGHIRNRRMLLAGCPDMVVAFPGGRGTANMIENARKEGVKVWEPYARRS